MKAVIGENEELIKETKRHYINDILIYSDSDDDDFYNKEVGKENLFKKFLDTDYRADFKEYNNDEDCDGN